MNEKTPMKVQDAFLHQICQEKILVTIYLMNGFQIRGVVQDFDRFTLLVTSDQKQQLVYKHAVSTISPSKLDQIFYQKYDEKSVKKN